MTNEMTHGLIKQSEAASYLGLSEATLERDRWRGGEIPYIKVGPRAIRYDLNQLNAYLESKTVRKEVMNHG
jgi:excisionase family DNA binding protein